MMSNRTIEQMIEYLNGRIDIQPPSAPRAKRDYVAEARDYMASKGIDRIPPAWPKIMAAMKEDTMPLKKGWLLYGGTGTGKTTRARLASEFAGIEMVTARHIFEELLSMPFHEASRIGTLTPSRRLRGSDLIIDDLGTEPQTATIYGNVRAPIVELLEERHALWPNIRTYITTNLSPAEIQERYGERVASRLEEMCARIRLDGEDRRRNK